MILDNENENLKVHQWIAKYNEEGVLDIVTGYFTIGALAYLSKMTNDNIEKYRFILGDIVNFDEKFAALDLLNENITIDISLKLNQYAQEAVAFLKLDKIKAKTLEPNFCHAKLYLKTAKTDERNHYFISGSSNLTEAGIGQKTTSNIELNIAETGNNNQYKELLKWFDSLWDKPQAHSQKTLIDENGKTYKKDFKTYLIEEISKLFKIYTPEQIYFKILFELFNEDNDNPEVQKQIIKLEDTLVFNTLYDFQKMGVKSLIKMLNKYNGAILADAVGLGKTWSALAIMKAFQSDHKVIVLCPKKLEQNWRQYQEGSESIFNDDKLDYLIRFHTDLREGGMQSKDIKTNYFSDEKKKLFVIDESHNLRNDKSQRYKYLINEVLQKSKGEIKILLLSATPINNEFKDVRNQFKIITKGDNGGFKESLDINNIEHTFRNIQNLFNEWSKIKGAKLSEFHIQIKESAFFRLTDNLLVARTRKSIKTYFDNSLTFPEHAKPINIFKTPLKFGDVENFAELMENMKLNLSAYQPSYYTITEDERKRLAKEKKERKKKGVKEEKGAVLKDEIQREHFLVKMMMILMLKRLESSWASFYITVERIYNHHSNTLNKISDYEKIKKDIDLSLDDETLNSLSEEDETGVLETFLLGKKSPIQLKAIDDAGNLDAFKKAIKEDKKTLKYILDNVNEFNLKTQNETGISSYDTKLEALLKIISEKQLGKYKKIVIFSAYKDTVQYLFDQLKNRNFNHFAMVSGNGNNVWNEVQSSNKHETILQRFAPYTKLFREKNWPDFKLSAKNLSPDVSFNEWKTWLKENDSKVLNLIDDKIDILLATDVLSEGQNLQDADMVINYDIHWNPVRVIQRVGRIDRIGSPHNRIQVINFWPAKDIDDYINLKNRVEKRMAAMKVTGSEVLNEFTDEFNEIAEAETLEAQQNANMLKQMENSLDETDIKETVGLDNFSFDNYRQLLLAMLSQKKKEFEDMPNGVFSGVKIEGSDANQNGIIALLGYPSKKKFDPKMRYLSYDLIYVDKNGNQISNNQKVILEELNRLHLLPRNVDKLIDCGDNEAIEKLSNAIKKWIESQVKTEVEQEDGSIKETISNAGLDLINSLKSNPQKAIHKLKTEGPISKKYKFDNFDLITWFIIS